MKIIHYINQFYAQIGGEEKADTPLSVRENAMIGPGYKRRFYILHSFY